MSNVNYKEWNDQLEKAGEIYGYHNENFTVSELESMTDERLLQIAKRRYSRQSAQKGRYTIDALKAQKEYQDRKGGFHSPEHYERDHTIIDTV